MRTHSCISFVKKKNGVKLQACWALSHLEKMSRKSQGDGRAELWSIGALLLRLDPLEVFRHRMRNTRFPPTRSKNSPAGKRIRAPLHTRSSCPLGHRLSQVHGTMQGDTRMRSHAEDDTQKKGDSRHPHLRTECEKSPFCVRPNAPFLLKLLLPVSRRI